MAKKKFKDTKFAKIGGSILEGALNLLPGDKFIIGAGKALINKLDKDGDGKLTIKDFNATQLAGLFGGLAVLSILVSQGVIDIAILEKLLALFGLSN